MTAGHWLLLATVLVPLACAVAGLAWRRRAWLLPLAPLPGLACALLVPPDTGLLLPQVLLGAVLVLDATAAVFLGFCALLWACAGAYALAYLGSKPHARGFCFAWQLTLAGSLGVCLAADAASFYVCFAALSLAAYVLVVHDRTPGALRAGRIYLVLAVAGEVALLLGLVLAVQGAGSLRIADIRAALPEAAARDAAIALLLAGLGLKAGLVPLHAWLPLAHGAAPAPASAVLSGAIVKAGILGLLRFLPVEAALPSWPTVLAVLGLVTAYAGVLLGVLQREPKPVLAYSTMSQMGLLVAVLGAGLASAQDAGTHAAVAFYALHHGLAKGALFLAAGLLALGWRRGPLLWVAALLGAAIAGAPLTGGALAKLATKGPLGEGWVATVAGASAVGTMLLMLRFLWLVSRPGPDAHGTHAPVPATMPAAFLLLAAAALALPWWLLPRITGTAPAYAWSAAGLWGAAWPVALALVLAALAWRRGPRLPAVPVGDIAAWADDALRRPRVPGWLQPAQATRAAAAAQRLAGRAAGRVALGCEAVATRLAQWPMAAGALLLLLAVLAAALHART